MCNFAKASRIVYLQTTYNKAFCYCWLVTKISQIFIRYSRDNGHDACAICVGEAQLS